MMWLIRSRGSWADTGSRPANALRLSRMPTVTTCAMRTGVPLRAGWTRQVRSWRDSRKPPALNQGRRSGEDQRGCPLRELETHLEEAFHDFAIKVGSCLLANILERLFIRPAFPVRTIRA